MVKIYPTNNLMFKKLFASTEFKHILMNFLQDLLGVKLKDITILEPYNIEQFKEIVEKSKKDKSVILFTEVDGICTAEDGTTFIVEMQINLHVSFPERTVYYISGAYRQCCKTPRSLKHSGR